MSSSLETLVDNLAADGLEHFKQFRKAFPSDDIAKLLLQKNEYCYDYVDCAEKCTETELPPKKHFTIHWRKSQFRMKNTSMHKHSGTHLTWNIWGEFHDLYVLTDTLLLANVFERFRDMTLENYELDASHFTPVQDWRGKLH